MILRYKNPIMLRVWGGRGVTICLGFYLFFILLDDFRLKYCTMLGLYASLISWFCVVNTKLFYLSGVGAVTLCLGYLLLFRWVAFAYNIVHNLCYVSLISWFFFMKTFFFLLVWGRGSYSLLGIFAYFISLGDLSLMILYIAWVMYRLFTDFCQENSIMLLIWGRERNSLLGIFALLYFVGRLLLMILYFAGVMYSFFPDFAS